MSSWYEMVAAEFEKIYGDIPEIECKGLCGDACGPIEMNPWERLQLRRAGVKLPPHREQLRLQQASPDRIYRCPALSEDDRCTVYEARPTICRLWGVFDGLRCPYGCRMEVPRLTDFEAVAILDRMYAAGTGREPHSMEELQQAYRDKPELAAVFDMMTALMKPIKTRKIPKE